MMKAWNFRYVFLFIISFTCACSTSGKDDQATEVNSIKPSWTITVSGKVGFPQQGEMISISEIKDGNQLGKQDTITLKSNYTFSKKLTLTEPGYYRLNFYNKQVVNLILFKDDVVVNVDGNNAQGFFEIKGSPDLELIKTVQELNRKIQELQMNANNTPEVTKLNQDYAVAVRNRDEKKIEEIKQTYSVLVKTFTDQIAKINDQITELMISNSPSLAVINLLQNNTIDKDEYFSAYVEVAEKLKKDWPDYSHAKSFIAFVDKLKTTAIGQPAPEISLPDPDGKMVSLSSFKGKYVLVDFWAKWCGPCRQENPNVVSAYNKFKDKGFTVFGVSLDRTREDWLRAIEEDGLTWTHVSDLKFWQSEAAKTYGITSIPFSILVDPNGIIIDKNLRGTELHQKLEEVLNKK